jgi:hypothetical protein
MCQLQFNIRNAHTPTPARRGEGIYLATHMQKKGEISEERARARVEKYVAR